MDQKERQQKGAEVEDYIKSILREKGLQIERNGQNEDFRIGRYIILEVKSAELVQKANAKSFRPGSFVLDPNVHKILLSGGYTHWYCLALTFQWEICLVRFIPCNKVRLMGQKLSFRNFYREGSLSLDQFAKLFISE
jgi:hypothetical protein